MLDRIKRFIETQNITASGFANVIGVQRSSVSHILSGRNKPSLDFVLKLKEHYPDLNLDWLLFGSGPILISKKPEREETKKSDKIDFNSSDINKTTETSKNLFDEEEAKVLGSNSIADKFDNDKSAKLTSTGFVNNKQGLKKLILLYDDNSFEEFNPSK